MDWFLYNRDFRHERVNGSPLAFAAIFNKDLDIETFRKSCQFQTWPTVHTTCSVGYGMIVQETIRRFKKFDNTCSVQTLQS